MLQLIKNFNQGRGEPPHIVLIFGVGLVGKAIAGEFGSRTEFVSCYQEFGWRDAVIQRDQFAALESGILDYAARVATSIGEYHQPRLTMIWSAGPCGFQSSEDELGLEYVNFKNVVDFSVKLFRLLASFQHDFHMVSSCGALFDGQRSVTALTTPLARRPYGRLKLRQESYLLQADCGLGKCLYRPSSIYGQFDLASRVGLIPRMLYNGIRNQTTEIYGSMDTIRDYIYVQDVSRFMSRQILATPLLTQVQTHILASARPASIINIKHLVEVAIGRQIYVNYHPQPSEYAHNSFMASALPSDVCITSLETGIRMIHQNLQSIL